MSNVLRGSIRIGLANFTSYSLEKLSISKELRIYQCLKIASLSDSKSLTQQNSKEVER